MTETFPQILIKHEWVEQPVARVRMKFRRDSTGFYEREGAPGARIVRDNYLFRLENGRLHLKFAHAREWTQVSFDIREGSAESGSRIGRWELFLERDPYAWTMEEEETPSLVLLSDSGAALLE